MLGKTFYILSGLGIIALAYKFVAFALVWQLAILGAMFLWAVAGAAMIGSGVKRNARAAAPSPLSKVEARAAAERAAYAARFGEAYAAKIDREDPRFWERVAAQPPVAK